MTAEIRHLIGAACGKEFVVVGSALRIMSKLVWGMEEERVLGTKFGAVMGIEGYISFFVSIATDKDTSVYALLTEPLGSSSQSWNVCFGRNFQDWKLAELHPFSP